MQCPDCKVPMEEFTVGDHMGLECRNCRGLWFEIGQIDSVKDEVLPEMSWLDIDSWKEGEMFEAMGDPRLCPSCGSIALTRIREREMNAEISICSECEGTWLAAGQFLIFVNLLLDEANRKTAPDLAKLALQQAKEILTNPDRAIAEWQGLGKILRLLRHRVLIENPKLKSVIAGFQKSLPL